MDMCGKRAVLSKYLFQYKMIHRYRWRRRDERGEQKRMIDYITMDEKFRKESEEELQRVVDKFYSLCMRRKLEVNVEKSKVKIVERRGVEVIDFNTHYKVSLPAKQK